MGMKIIHSLSPEECSLHPFPEQSPGRQPFACFPHTAWPSESSELLKRSLGDLDWEVHLQAQCGQVLEEAWFRLSALTLLFPQLALSPSPRNPAEPIAVQNNQQLALKVEGVVQHGSKPGLFRRIQSVCLSVSSTLQSKSSQDYKVTHVRKNCVQHAGPRWGSPLLRQLHFHWTGS